MVLTGERFALESTLPDMESAAAAAAAVVAAAAATAAAGAAAEVAAPDHPFCDVVPHSGPRKSWVFETKGKVTTATATTT